VAPSPGLGRTALDPSGTSLTLSQQGIPSGGGPTTFDASLYDVYTKDQDGNMVQCNLFGAHPDQGSRQFWAIPCPSGFGATFDSGTGTVTYWHGDFSGSFHAEGVPYGGGEGNYGGGMSWQANVWGC
jgi:hypothetical protein